MQLVSTIPKKKEIKHSLRKFLINFYIMKLLPFIYYKLKSNFLIIAVLILFAVMSCNPARNDSGQSPEQPALQQKQVQQNPVKEVSPSAETPVTPDQPLAGQTGEKVRLNPPHGQPGHRCEIPVGSPLDAPPANADTKGKTPASSSPPATATVNNPTAPTIQNANRLNPSQSRNNTEPATGTKPGNNPPHGQPWHRCDIPVGSPLP
jgi:hypothetical protein